MRQRIQAILQRRGFIAKAGFAAAVVALTAGMAAANFAAADDSITISNTGYGSVNNANINNNTNTTVTNTNSVSVINSSIQTAISGSSNVSGNTTGGSATSGSAGNSNSTNTSISISN